MKSMRCWGGHPSRAWEPGCLNDFHVAPYLGRVDQIALTALGMWLEVAQFLRIASNVERRYDHIS